MGIEQKLDYFAEVMMQEAADAKQRTLQEKNARRIRGLSLALEETRETLHAHALAQTREIKKESYKQIAKALAEARQTLWVRRQTLTRALFDEAAEKIRAFALSGGYDDYLETAIHDVKAASGLTEVMREADSVGGFVLYDKAQTQRIDFTFQTRLNDAMVAFMQGQENHGDG
ncbi:MAG: hypothetical protein FWC16_15045 [Defluviitaleaceae bacterium]|nr:hypothetical protein [Defluviitaleaceae bacterium]MCL2276233.1 hypothetical protein [Defluviitaleaceae bacterium]